MECRTATRYQDPPHPCPSHPPAVLEQGCRSPTSASHQDASGAESALGPSRALQLQGKGSAASKAAFVLMTLPASGMNQGVSVPMCPIIPHPMPWGCLDALGGDRRWGDLGPHVPHHSPGTLRYPMR